MNSWEWHLPQVLAETLAARGHDTLTPVQRAVLQAPPAADLLLSAPPGSGKTVAYGLALARRLLDPARPGGQDGAGGPEGPGPRALVVAPTRELAVQVQGELSWLLARLDIRVVCCTGGSDLRAEAAALAANPCIVVGTPGRLEDQLARGALSLGRVEIVVLDEVDSLVEPGFRTALDTLLVRVPGERQMILVSATLSAASLQMARELQRPAAPTIEVTLPAAAATLQAVAVAARDRDAAIVNLLRLHEPRGAIVFCGRREAVATLTRRLAARGFSVVALSAALNQRGRAAAVAAMRDGRARVCVATDLAARGIDLPALDLVLHADLPGDATTLVHRSGRSGRAGRMGMAVMIVPALQRRRAESLAARAGVTLDWLATPGAADVDARDLSRLMEQSALLEAPQEHEVAAGGHLLAEHGAEQVATALWRLWRAARPQPEPLGPAQAVPNPPWRRRRR